MKHEWQRDADGEVDIFAMSEGHHNGPKCVRCGAEFCHHCNPECYQEDCPVPAAVPQPEEPRP